MVIHNKPKRPKRYPDLNFRLEKGSVRMFRAALRLATPTKLVTTYVRKFLTDKVEIAITYNQLKTGRIASLDYHDYHGFDEHVAPFESCLCDIEQFALLHLLKSSNPFCAFHRIPNAQTMPAAIGQIEHHIKEHGGIDTCKTVENLALLHPESVRVNDYLDANIPEFFQYSLKPTNWFKKMFTG
jgi:hypothetical protein